MARTCPVDQSALMSRRLQGVQGQVEVDACPRCQGVFLDADELLHLSGDAALNAALKHEHAVDEGSRRMCPRCGLRMDHEEARGVEVEVCRKCDGLWFDRNELDRLLASARKPSRA